MRLWDGRLNADPDVETAEAQLVAGWAWALTAAPRPAGMRDYATRATEVLALMIQAHAFDPRLGQRRPWDHQ